MGQILKALLVPTTVIAGAVAVHQYQCKFKDTCEKEEPKEIVTITKEGQPEGIEDKRIIKDLVKEPAIDMEEIKSEKEETSVEDIEKESTEEGKKSIRLWFSNMISKDKKRSLPGKGITDSIEGKNTEDLTGENVDFEGEQRFIDQNIDAFNSKANQ